MATDADIAYVRRNTSELTDANYSDETIGLMIDASGVDETIAFIWEEKAAKYVSAVDVTEAGASHKFSDLFKNASAMAAYWRKKVTPAEEPHLQVKVKKIVRS